MSGEVRAPFMFGSRLQPRHKIGYYFCLYIVKKVRITFHP